MPLGSFLSGFGNALVNAGAAATDPAAYAANLQGQQQIGQVLSQAQAENWTPGKTAGALGELGYPAAVRLATSITQNQPAFNPLTPKDTASIQAQVYAANPLMNSPPDLSGAQQPQQALQGAIPALQQGRMQPGMQGPQQQAQGGVNPRELGGQEWLDYLAQKAGPGFANQVQAIAEGRAAPPSPSSQSKMAQLINQAVAQYKPDFDFAGAANNFKNRQATELEFSKGTAANNIKSIGTASNHLATLVNQIGDVSNSDYPLVNRVGNFISKEKGSSGPTKFEQTADALASELGAVYKGAGHNSDTEIANMRKALDPNASAEQKYAALQNGLHLMEGRASELAEQYNRGKNLSEGDKDYKTPDDFLSPEAKNNITKAKQAIFNFQAKGQVGSGAPAPAASNLPAVGQVVKGYKFLGGNPADKNSWTKQ